jgi:hypothetical protein
MVKQGMSIGAEACRRREEVDEKTDNDSVDSLICAGGFSNKMVLRGNILWIQEMTICERRLYGFKMVEDNDW